MRSVKVYSRCLRLRISRGGPEGAFAEEIQVAIKEILIDNIIIQISFKKSRGSIKKVVCDKNLFLYPKW